MDADREIHDYIVNKDKRTSKAAQVSLPIHSLTDGWMDGKMDRWMDGCIVSYYYNAMITM